MASSNRGTFKRHPADIGVFLTTDGPRDGGRMEEGNKRYIYSEIGRFNSFPHHSLPYSITTSADLARYGFVWCHDGSRLGYVKCVYCNHKIMDYQEPSLAAIRHMMEQPICPLLGYTANNMVANRQVELNDQDVREVKICTEFEQILDHFVKHPVLDSSYIKPGGNSKCNGKSTIGERASSFPKAWKCPVPVCDLARYGFHWLGKEDKVKCNECGLVVKNWQKDDLAAIVHTICNPFCKFMQEC